MVSTRHHPKPFPEPATPTKSPSHTSPPASPTVEVKTPSTKENGSVSSSKALSSSTSRRSQTKSSSKTMTKDAHITTYTHTPTPFNLIWLLVSVTLVVWDTGYVFLRPHSMPGGKFHSPIWSPYGLYANVDYIYGFPAYNDGTGFTAAQSALNIVETLMYMYYLWVISDGAENGVGIFGAAKRVMKAKDDTTPRVKVQGERVALAVMMCFAASIMTVSKTVLYWLHEYFSGFENIGHNSARDLFFLWIIPNGLWLVFPSYMIYTFGSEIMECMQKAQGLKDG